MNHACANLVVTMLLLGCTALLTGCFSGPRPAPVYFLQTSTQQQLEPGLPGFAEMILVMPVRLAPQLQGRGLLLQDASGETMASLNHRWTGPLDQQIADTVSAELKSLLGTDHVSVYPGPRYGVTRYQLELEIHAFGAQAGLFTVQAVYTLNDAASKTMLQRKSFTTTQTMDNPDPSGYVAAASQAVAQLSRAAAEALIAAHRSQSITTPRHEN